MATYTSQFKAVTLAVVVICATVLPPSHAACVPGGTGTATQITDLIDGIASASAQLQSVATSIDPLTSPVLFILGQGPIPKVITTLTGFIVTASSAVPMLVATPALDATDSDAVFESFRKFVVIHQQLLNIFIGKAGLFSVVPFIGAPIAAVFRSLESIVDTVAFLLIDIAQSRGNDLKLQNDKLHASFDTTVTAYSGLAVPAVSVKVGSNTFTTSTLGAVLGGRKLQMAEDRV